MAKRKSKKKTINSEVKKIVTIVSTVIFVVAIAIYVVFLIKPELKTKIFGRKTIQTVKKQDSINAKFDEYLHPDFNKEDLNLCSDNVVENVIYNTFQIHFIENGTWNTGDSTYIKAGDIDIVIDAGASTQSAPTLINYIDKYCTDGILEYVITTHAHMDHWGGMFGSSNTKHKEASVAFPSGTIPEYTGLMYYYKIGTIIDFARTNNEETKPSYVSYKNAVSYAVSNGSSHYNAKECFEETNGAKRKYILDETLNMSFEILYNKYYTETSADENNYSVCTLFSFDTKHFIFTGDLELDGENALASYYDGTSEEKTLPEVELFKAGHHGSKTSSNHSLLKMIKPKICCVCCCAGSDEYTVDLANVFPTQEFINRIAKYTDRVYVTTKINEFETRKQNEFIFESFNGSITVSSNGSFVGLYATNNLVKLKDSNWFNELVYVKLEGGIYSIAQGGKKSKLYYTKGDDGAVQKRRRTWPTK